jgi:heptosyltransferase-2
MRSLLIRAPNWIGDAALSLSLCRHLKTSLPAVELHILCRRTVAPVYEGFGRITAFNSLWDLYPTALRLRTAAPDAALVLPLSMASALSATLTGAGTRVGYRSDLRSPLLTERLPLTRDLRQGHQALQYFGLLPPLGIRSPKMLPAPALIFEDRELESTDQRLPSPFVALSPFAAFGPSKEWRTDRFLALAGDLTSSGIRVLVLGGPGERERAGPFDTIPGVHNRVGTLSLRETAALLHRASVLVGNDSGLSHLAASAGTRVIAIFGATDPKRSHPLCPHRVLYRPARCSPCYRRTCSEPSHPCMESITVEEVRQEVDRVLSDPAYPKSFTLEVPPT